MLTKEGRVKVVDFGLAVPTGEVFLATEVVGTPIYMAPEQADGLRLDGRCDQYRSASRSTTSSAGGRPSRRHGRST